MLRIHTFNLTLKANIFLFSEDSNIGHFEFMRESFPKCLEYVRDDFLLHFYTTRLNMSNHLMQV